MTTAQKRTKVLHLITLSVVGGSQDNTFSTAELHDRKSYEVHLASNPHGHWVDRAIEAGDVFHPVPTLVTPPRPLKDLKAFWDILRLLQREKFDLVHTHTAKAGFVGRMAASICRVPCVVHTYHALPFHAFMPAWKRWFYVSLERLARPWTDFFITVSENTREEGLARGVLDRGRSRTIYSGIDFSKLDKAAEPKQIRAQLAIPDGWKTIVMVGRLDAQKAPNRLIEAFRRTVKMHPQTLLVVAGDGELRRSVEDLIQRLGLNDNVRLLGFRNDVADIIKMADIFALSSLWEGLGRAMTEAMLLGKPVVVPRINGIPEIVQDGQTGLLYEPGNVAQLAAQMSRLLDCPEEGARLGENARQLTRKLFDVNLMVEQIEGIYDELVHQKGSPSIHFESPLAEHAPPKAQLRTGAGK
jgi:glycosyltransferase involved in cell wall biosynthesis